MFNKNIYLTDDFIFIGNKKTKEIKKIALPKNLVINGKVANINKFMEVLEKIVKDNNLNNKIMGENIKIIVGPKYTNTDVTVLKNIMEKLNFHKIMVEQESRYYKLNKDKAYLNILNNYMLLTFINDYKKEESYLINKDLFIFKDDVEDLDFLMAFIKKKIKKKELYLIGYGKEIKSFYESFEKKYQNITYLFSNHETYIIDSVINL